MQEQVSVDLLPIDKYLTFVYEVAHYRHHRLCMAGVKYIEKEELVSVGYFGLNDAYTTFDPGRKCPFEYYAKYKINQAITLFLRGLDLVSKENRRLLNLIKAAEDKLMQELGRMPAEEEVAKEIGLSLEKLQKLKAARVIVEALEDKSDEFSFSPINYLTVEADFETEIVDSKKISKAINDCIKRVLTAQQALILLLMDNRAFSAREVMEMISEEEVDINVVFYQRTVARKEMRKCMHRKGYSLTDVI